MIGKGNLKESIKRIFQSRVTKFMVTFLIISLVSVWAGDIVVNEGNLEALGGNFTGEFNVNGETGATGSPGEQGSNIALESGIGGAGEMSASGDGGDISLSAGDGGADSMYVDDGAGGDIFLTAGDAGGGETNPISDGGSVIVTPGTVSGSSYGEDGKFVVQGNSEMNGTLYVEGNVTADGYETHSFVWDTDKFGSSFDYLIDVSKLKNPDGSFNHDAEPEPFKAYKEVVDTENCDEKGRCETKLVLSGSWMDRKVEWLRAVAYDLFNWNEEQDSRITELEQENQALKTELCSKDSSYSWC